MSAHTPVRHKREGERPSRKEAQIEQLLARIPHNQSRFLGVFARDFNQPEMQDKWDAVKKASSEVPDLMIDEVIDALAALLELHQML